MPTQIWKVKFTPCHPCGWKVYPDFMYRERNATHNYFHTEAEAQAEADRRNARARL